MKIKPKLHNPHDCPVEGCDRKVSPMSKSGVCMKCDHVIRVIEMLVKREQEALQKGRSKRIILPDEVRHRLHR